MNWVFEHIQVIILIAGAIAYWLNQRRKAQEEQNEEQRRMAEPPQTTMHAPAPADDEAERVRRIQEEIRRKILERAGGGVPRQLPPPMPEPRYQREVAPEPVQHQAPVKADVYAQAAAEEQAILERQQQLAEQLRELDAQRRHTVSKAEAFAEKTEAVMTASHTPVRGSLLADLRNPTAARRAIVMREVLGAPVGMR